MDDISAAVDKAASASPGSSPATPTSTDSAPATAAASSPATPAAGSGSESTPSATSPSAGSATTQQGAADENLQDADWQKIPSERQTKILDNARKKEAERVTTDLLSRFGLTPDDDPADIAYHLHGLRTNAVNHVLGMLRHFEQQGLLKRPTPATPHQPAQPLERPKPSYPAQTVDGQQVMLYGPEDIDKLLEWQAQQIDKRYADRFAPLEQTHNALQRQNVELQGQELARQEFAEAQRWDKFEELRPEIHKRMKADARKTLVSTYREVYEEAVKNERATLKEKTRLETLAELNKRPDPNTINPGTPLPRTANPTAKRDVWQEGLEHALTANTR